MSEVRWYKGNLHTHTNKSDGDASPEKVARWYGRHGYDFLTLSDHDRLTLLGRLRGKTEATIPLLIPGEELQVSLSGGDMVIHLNAIGISKQVDPIIVKEVTSGIQTNVNTILDAGGIASINHPNYSWALDHETIARITGVSLVEVFNGEPAVNMYAAPGRENYEQIWDGVLSTGRLIYGVATDDAHNYLDFSLGLSPNPPMDGARTGEGGKGVTGAMIRARIRVDGRLAGGLQALLGAPMSACSGCGERDGRIGHGKRRSRTGMA